MLTRHSNFFYFLNQCPPHIGAHILVLDDQGFIIDDYQFIVSEEEAMKSYHTNLGAGIDGIALTECDEPRPGPRQILMRVRAASLNARELSIQRGYYPLPIKPDLIPVSDGAG